MTNPMTVYFNGTFLPKSEVRISPDDRGFLFADGVYEVIASYGGRLFEADAHLTRLHRSLRQLRIDEGALPGLDAVCTELLHRNGLDSDDAKVYIQITRGVAPRSHAFPKASTAPTVYAYCSPFEPSL